MSLYKFIQTRSKNRVIENRVKQGNTVSHYLDNPEKLINKIMNFSEKINALLNFFNEK